jgi:hypothetical protein
VRARWLYSAAAIWPSIRPRLHGGDVRGWFTLGWFAINNTYFARPDNTGLELFRYAAHVDISPSDGHFADGLDAIMFTDKLSSNKFAPASSTSRPRSSGASRATVHLAYERDMPVDQGGLIQQFVYLLGGVVLNGAGAVRSWGATQLGRSPPRWRRAGGADSW